MFSNAAQRTDLAGIHPLKFKGQESELPSGYDKDCLVAMPRDPNWIFCYWDFNRETWQKITNYINEIFFLRVCCNGKELVRVPVSPSAHSWYINSKSPGSNVIVDLGIETDFGYLPFLTSNTISMPPDSISQKTDEVWLSIDELYSNEYYTKLGASPISWQKEGQKRAEYMASPLPIPTPEERAHFLWVDTDLIIYGKTTPESVLLQNGQVVSVDSNGNFQMQVKLNEGTQNLQLVSYSKTGLVNSKTIKIERG